LILSPLRGKMSNLRSDLIRLAHTNPDLRSHILPILKEADAPDFQGWLNRLGLVQALKAATSRPLAGMSPEQKAIITKAAALLKAIEALPASKAPAPAAPTVKLPPGNPLASLPSNTVDAMIYARYPSYFDGELPQSSRVEILNNIRAKWAKMSPEELKELLAWVKKNAPMLRQELTRHGLVL